MQILGVGKVEKGENMQKIKMPRETLKTSSIQKIVDSEKNENISYGEIHCKIFALYI